MSRILRLAGVLAALALLALAVPLPHVEELRDGDVSAVMFGTRAQAAQSSVCDKTRSRRT